MSTHPNTSPEPNKPSAMNPDLAHWLDTTTGDLPEDVRDNLRQEIITHYHFACEDALMNGQTPEQAHIIAMIALGDTSISREAMTTTYLSHRRFLKAAGVALATPAVYLLAWLGWDVLDGWWLFVSELVIMVALIYMLITLKVVIQTLYSFGDVTREARWTTISFVSSGLFTAFWLVLVKHYGETGMNRPTVRTIWIVAMSGQMAMGLTSIWIGTWVLNLKSRFSASPALGYAHILVGLLFAIGVIINMFFRNFELYRQLEIMTEIMFMIVFTLWGVVYLQATRKGRYVLK